MVFFFWGVPPYDVASGIILSGLYADIILSIESHFSPIYLKTNYTTELISSNSVISVSD